LLERFHEAGIAFRTQPRSPRPEPEPTVVIDISVDPVRASEVAQIHRDLLGDGLPNYASSFFREYGNVEPGIAAAAVQSPALMRQLGLTDAEQKVALADSWIYTRRRYHPT